MVVMSGSGHLVIQRYLGCVVSYHSVHTVSAYSAKVEGVEGTTHRGHSPSNKATLPNNCKTLILHTKDSLQRTKRSNVTEIHLNFKNSIKIGTTLQCNTRKHDEKLIFQ